ncbi:hypothetical protein JTB14_024224 [Gonioctena quinquepunctata]|nr:hypothetical protein JTB14_024224 [Gonioctena quinquepunctata]
MSERNIVLSIITFILVSFYINLAPNGYQFSVPGLRVEKFRKYSRCGSVLNLLDCHSLIQLSFSRMEAKQIRSEYEPGKKCDIKNVSFDWILSFENETKWNFHDYNKGDIFVMKSYSLDPGNYRLVLNVAEHDGNGIKNMLSDACLFTITTESSPPIAAGAEEMKSIEKFSVKRYALDEPAYYLNSSVKTKGSDWQSIIQTIRVKRQTPDLSIACKINCSPYVNVSRDSTVNVKCKKNCQNLNLTNTLSWSMNISNFDYKKNTYLGKNTEEFTIKANVLQFGRVYLMNLNYKGKLMSQGVVRTHPEPKLNFCEIQPSGGTALKTIFHVVNCQFEGLEPRFELQSINGDKEFLLGEGPRLEDLEFVLNYKAKVKVIIIDKFNVSASMILNVPLVPAIQNVKSKDDLINKVQSASSTKTPTDLWII